ncbi:hypothetical protein [Methyloferula stellata]|uniref:hypothetical protein n=1 Tax=Methyloferula stellata TaxID=876270 RepID=UPI00036C180C|nr:hypothetical protein [Methyloferula stellata]
MRTIDPFFAPGLWGGAPMPPQSPTMTAGRLSSPQRRPAVIAPLLAHAPLASLTGSVLGPRFHAWYGRSRRRTICSVYLVRDDEAKGLPDFADGIVIAARRDAAGLRALAVFALGDSEDRRAWVEEAISAGAMEWHVHLLAEDDKERRALLQDLGG